MPDVSKCYYCKINEGIKMSEKADICPWYFMEVFLGDKTVEECTMYKEMEDDGG